MKTRIVVLSTAALMTLALVANAQYTPGSGGSYIGPSTPYVPAPAPPQGPTRPPYSWEVPAQPQPIVVPSSSVLPPAPPDAIRVVSAPPAYMPQLSQAQIADLTSSIALYPDPLLAELFPASTFIEELTYADRWQEQHPGADDRTIASLPLDDSVKAMMHYPSVLDLMIGHLDWTQSLGLAFAYQRQDLFESVQRWRSTAVANGYLFSTPQQEILQQGTVILIQPPARTQVVYVPVYDPAVVYVRARPGFAPPRNVITFGGNGFSLSFALNDVDWHDHEVRIPRHDDPRDTGRGGIGDPRGGIGGTPRGGIGDTPRGGGTISPPLGRGVTPPLGGRGLTTPDTKTVFVPKDPKPGLVYPQKVITPTPDKKVITLPGTVPTTPGRGPIGPGGPAGIGGPGRGPGGIGAPGRGPGGIDTP